MCRVWPSQNLTEPLEGKSDSMYTVDASSTVSYLHHHNAHISPCVIAAFVPLHTSSRPILSHPLLSPPIFSPLIQSPLPHHTTSRLLIPSLHNISFHLIPSSFISSFHIPSPLLSSFPIPSHLLSSQRLRGVGCKGFGTAR